MCHFINITFKMNNITTNFQSLQLTFSWLDYSLFLLMLCVSLLIGLYFGFCGHQDNASEYLLGGKQMTSIPIGISLVASHISGVTLLGVPTDIFRFGVNYYLYVVTLLPICLITYYVYIPVFYKLQVVSSYEYLMLRFNKTIRLFASGLFVINNLLYLPIVVYIPALALAHATHISLHYITPIVCGVCILYTTLGGLKAVVWTDTIQFVVMIGSIITVFCHGVTSIGGYGEVWKRALDGGRFDLDFDMDPTKRDTVFATLIGWLFMGFPNIGINQSFVQKYLSMPSRNDIRKALIIFYIGMIIMMTLVTGIGIVIFAKYYQCDPFKAGKIAKHDQILPFYVMEVATAIPGLAGLFLSGILSAALSTLSAWMNSLAASVYEDFVSPFVPSDISQRQISNILKLLVVVIGTVSTLMVYVVEHMGSIVPINFALASITNGPILGLFTLGMMFPVANSKGALYGSVLSMSIMTFIIGGKVIHEMAGHISYPSKPVSIEGCNQTFNLTSNITPIENDNIEEENIFVLFRITHYYYTVSGTILTVFFGILISYFTRKETDPDPHPDTITPFVHCISRKLNKKRQDIPVIIVEDAETLLMNKINSN